MLLSQVCPTRRCHRTGRAPRACLTALLLAASGMGVVPATAAKPAAVPAGSTTPPAETVPAEVIAVEGGKAVGQMAPANARRDGLTVVDLSDDWLPTVFSE